MSVMKNIIAWRERHVSDRQLTLLLSFVVGVLAAVAGYVLHWIISEIQLLLTAGFDITSFNWLYLVLPVVGIYLTSLFVRYIVRDDIGHGITRILYAISRKRSRIKGHNCWSSVVASAITIGFGGSVGAEAPIVLTGSAIGSNLGKLFHMDNKTMMLLVGCGASAAIAGVFKAPIAGLVFTLEVLMVDLTMASLLPILISSVTATCFTYIFVGSSSLFSFQLDNDWLLERVPATILLGVCCGLLSLWFIRASSTFEWVFERLGKNHWAKLALGGVVLSSLIFLFPSLFGEGYDSISILLNGKTEADWETIMNNSLFYGHSDLLILYVGLVVFSKVFATTATNGRLWNMYQIGVYVPEKNFSLLGMAGVMAGVMHAPLTGIFLIAELTGGYRLFVPLIIVCICSYLTIIIFEPHSIYGMRLARQGQLITHHTDRAVLTLMSLDSVIERDVTPVSPDMELGKLIHFISRSRINIIPVVDDAGQLLGEIDVTKLRHIVFRTELYTHFRVSQLMTQPHAVLGDNDPMDEVMEKFDSTDASMLPVIDSVGHLKGYVARAHLYNQYRQMVADMSAE